MARLINLSTPDCGISDGMELSFRAPCECSDVTGITLDGQTYDLVDTSGNSLSGCSKYFSKDATLTVILDIVNKKATLLNPRVNTYTKTLGTPEDTASASGNTVWARVKQIENDMSGKAPSKHTHTKSEITDFAHNHDDRYYTEDEVETKLAQKADNGTVVDIADWKAKVMSGTTAVKRAESASKATSAEQATLASTAINASNDSQGNSIQDTYAKRSTLSNGAYWDIHATSAINASNDANGNPIHTTYAKITDVATGNITAFKSFYADVVTATQQTVECGTNGTTVALADNSVYLLCTNNGFTHVLFKRAPLGDSSTAWKSTLASLGNNSYYYFKYDGTKLYYMRGMGSTAEALPQVCTAYLFRIASAT